MQEKRLLLQAVSASRSALTWGLYTPFSLKGLHVLSLAHYRHSRRHKHLLKNGHGVVGAAGSIITLITTARPVFNACREMYEAIAEAPNELRSVFLKAQLVSSTLEQILALRPRIDDGDAQLLPLDLRTGPALSLQTSHESLQKLKKLCGGTNGRGKCISGCGGRS